MSVNLRFLHLYHTEVLDNVPDIPENVVGALKLSGTSQQQCMYLVLIL